MDAGDRALALVGWSGCGPLQGGINHGVGGSGESARGGGGSDGELDMSIDDTGDGGSAYDAASPTSRRPSTPAATPPTAP